MGGTDATGNTDAAGGTDLGGMLRALRRQADLSQRQLAERAGVPQPTLARIESGRAVDPGSGRWNGSSAAGGQVGIGVSSAAASPSAPTPVPHDDMRDEAGRRYPAHLDVWPVHEPRDWPGAWWAEWHSLPPERYPLRCRRRRTR
ncbi:helix-turn-helix transcriptional regulator [Micromonospora sp. M12]